MMKTLTHEADGLILQGADAPYIVGTCPELLKWKFAHLNSVDFRLRLTDRGPQLLLFCRGSEEVLEGIVSIGVDLSNRSMGTVCGRQLPLGNEPDKGSLPATNLFNFQLFSVNAFV